MKRLRQLNTGEKDMARLTTQHFAELLLQLKLRGEKDRLRARSGFSDDLLAVNALLNNPKARKQSKIAAYRKWIHEGQPCIFGRTAARTGHGVYICLVEERDILTMRRGDDDLRNTIVDHQKVWKRYALHGLSSSFVIVVLSDDIARVAPDSGLKDLCRRLMELYLGSAVGDDEYLLQHEYVYLAIDDPGSGKRKFLRFATLPNIFCAQGDKRWWHDHRTPGAIMITSNALGHFIHCRARGKDPDKVSALKQAMQTILNAYRPARRKRRGLPATWLVNRKKSEVSPLANHAAFGPYSAGAYQGYFHTDHLIPAAYFEDRAPTRVYEDLDFTYIYDEANPEHAELTSGDPADLYTVKKEVWLPEGKNLASDFTFDRAERVEAYKWLESRLWDRCR